MIIETMAPTTKATVVMTTTTTKIRITVETTEKKNGNNTATQVTIKTEVISSRKH